jgi:hypothetical protein
LVLPFVASKFNQGALEKMENDFSDTPRTVTITAVKDEAAKRAIAETLSRITSGHPPVERVLARLENLPWRLTRNARVSGAKKLVSVLEGLGASVEISPPLPVDSVPGSQPPTEVSRAPVAASLPSENQQTQSRVAAAPQAFPSQERVVRQEKSEMADSGEFLLEPLSLGGILDRTFQICRSHFWKLLAIASIPVLITAAVALAGISVFLLAGLTWQALGGLPQWIMIAGAILVVPSIIVFLVALFYLSQGAMIHAVSFIYLSRNIVVREAYRFVTGKLGRFVFTSFLFAAAASGFVFTPVLLGIGAYFAFGLFTSGWWSAVTWPFLTLIPVYGITKLLLFDKVVIIEDTAYLAALKRSWLLIQGKADQGWPKTYFMRLVVLLHLFVLIYWTVTWVFQAPAEIIAGIISKQVLVAQILKQLLGTIGSMVGSIFGSVCLVVFYYDLRNRKEGFDLKMLARMDER